MVDATEDSVGKPELVILLHGMARTGRSMAGMGRFLEGQGFQVLNLTYPSRRKKLDALAKDVQRMIAASPLAAQAQRLHFVTHSMGGLVARRLFEKHRPERLGRTVMLGTPHRGSEVADWLKATRLYHLFYGPAGQELTTDHRAVRMPDRDIDFELGVIAGTVGWPYPLGCLLLPGPHDGRVSVESTKVPGMKGHIALPVAHSFMMGSREVQRQTVSFLKAGRFAD